MSFPSSEFLNSHRPENAAEVCELVRAASKAGHAIYPHGGRSQWDLGRPPTRPGILLDTRGLEQIVDYPSRDMTITVQAGMTVERLQSILAGERQRLPVDVRRASEATIGGIIATNVSGPRRFAHGTLRDYVIGISVVNDQGQETKAGGRVVKNVAGYDLCKLHIGALGTLGVITQVTFKVRPIPEEQTLLAFTCSPEELEGALAGLHAAPVRPVCIEVLNPESAPGLSGTLQADWPKAWTIVVGFEGNTEEIEWQVRQLIQEFGGRRNVSAALGHCANALWTRLIEFSLMDDSLLSFNAGVPASAVAKLMLETNAALTPVRLLAHAGNGIVVGHCAKVDAREIIVATRSLAASAGGHLVVTRCPQEWKSSEFVWGPPRGDFAMMKTVKEKLDPARLFNPGRFVDGI